MDKATTHGPLINERAIQKVEAHVKDAVERGAELRLGGKRANPDDMNGFFYEPTLLTNVTLEMDCLNQENFGPVLSLYRFQDDDEAIRVANDSEYVITSSLSPSLSFSYDRIPGNAKH